MFRAVIILLAIGFSLSACSTVRPKRTGRVGFMERLAIEDRKSGGRSAQESSVFQKKSTRAARLTESSDDAGLRGVQISRLKRYGMQWPLSDVQVTSKFGSRNGDQHEGIDLRAKVGTPVFAAHFGRVLYAGSGIRGYGGLLVLKHPTGFATVYAHNSRLLVKKGAMVRQGQRVALSGNTGHSSGPHLHFEVRSGVVALDPQSLLGSPNSTAPLKANAKHSRRIASSR